MSLPSSHDHKLELPSAPPTTTSLIVIEDCVADQLIGEDVVRLASGALRLYVGANAPTPDLVWSDSTSESRSGDSETNSRTKGALTLRIGNAAFSLEPSLTTVFTHAENARWYFFSLTLSSEATSSSPSPDVPAPAVHPTSTGSVVGSGSYIRLTLPEGVSTPGSAEEKVRDAFEDVLIGRGFLSGDPLLSAADEIGRRISYEASTAASTLRERTQQHVSSADAPPVPKSNQQPFSPTTHSFVDGRTNPGQRRSSVTEWAAEKLANVSIAVGERVASMFGIYVPTEEEQLEAGVTSSPTHQLGPSDHNRRDDLDVSAFVTGSATPSEGGLAPTESDATPISWTKPAGSTPISAGTHEVLEAAESTTNHLVRDLPQPAVKESAEDGLNS